MYDPAVVGGQRDRCWMVAPQASCLPLLPFWVLVPPVSGTHDGIAHSRAVIFPASQSAVCTFLQYQHLERAPILRRGLSRRLNLQHCIDIPTQRDSHLQSSELRLAA